MLVEAIELDKQHVLHINCNYIGTPLHQTMVEHLSALGIDNLVFVPTYNANTAIIKANSNVRVCECFNKWDRLLFDYKQSKIIAGLEKNLEPAEFDLIHAYTLFTDGNCARKISKKYGIPYVVAVRNTDVNTFFKLRPHLRKRGIQIMQDAEAVFFLSKTYRDQVFNQYIPRELQEAMLKKTYIIPNGIDDFWHTNKNNENRTIHSPIRLIYAGTITKNKNIEETQEAMHLLTKKGIETELMVVGKIIDKSIHKKITDDPQIKYHSPVPKEELIDFYRNADIFVMPSHTESFGLVYAEAMSQGLPVIYTKWQGFDGQFDEGEVGFHVSDKRYEEIAEAIESICSKYNELSANSVKGIERFKWDRICKNYRDLYCKILEK